MAARFALPLLVALVACGNSYPVEGPPPFCAPPDGGERCSCPGNSIEGDFFGCAQTFTCLEDGTWAPYDAACPELMFQPIDASTDDEAGRPDGGGDASGDGSMVDGTGQEGATDGARSDSGEGGESPDAEGAGD